MSASQHYRIHIKALLLAMITVIASLLAGVVVVSAVDPFPGLPNDGRVNVVHHFGGDALYCVDRNMNPTDQFSDDNFGGIRLLNIHGQELWFVPADEIEEAAALAEATPGLGVEVITAPGTYGPSYLYVFADQEEDGIIKFQFVAYDEWGKTNMMEFKFCEPVGPISGGEVPGDTPVVLCDPTSDNYCGCASGFCESLASGGDITYSECLDTYFPEFDRICVN
jgi:hypothetical protein